MEEKEYKKLMKQIKKEQEEIKNSKEAAANFLKKLGIMDKNCNIKKNIYLFHNVFYERAKYK